MGGMLSRQGTKRKGSAPPQASIGSLRPEDDGEVIRPFLAVAQRGNRAVCVGYSLS